MLLTIDGGNSNVVFAIYQKCTCMGQWRLATRIDRTADEYRAQLLQLLALEGWSCADVDAAIIASVVPAATHALKTLCQDCFAVEPLVVGEQGVVAPGLDLANCAEVGADLIANTVGAHARYGGPLVVVDFGTATTLQVVTSDGGLGGGCICPGLNLSLEALTQAAAKLPRVVVRRPHQVIAKATVPAMEAGAYFGHLGMIESLIARMSEEFGQSLEVVATGGMAHLFVDGTNAIDHLDQDLTLCGLVEIYRRNFPIV